jgi:hypothetical protein
VALANKMARNVTHVQSLVGQLIQRAFPKKAGLCAVISALMLATSLDGNSNAQNVQTDPGSSATI